VTANLQKSLSEKHNAAGVSGGVGFGRQWRMTCSEGISANFVVQTDIYSAHFSEKLGVA
jgi:hypothetical protein